MRRFVACLVALVAFALPATAADAKRPPNIVFIMADDLGCYELGCYGQTKIKTPNVDQLAANGMKFTHFYAGSPVCAPARCTLMTGKHTGHATIRNNRQFKKGEEGQYPIRAADVTVTELLKAKGLRDRRDGQVGAGQLGHHRHADEARLRPVLRLQLPGARA